MENQKVKVLMVRRIPNGAPALCRALGVGEDRPCLGLLTTDCDDATYIALDEATKKADVQVAFGASFYGGAANATTPYAGEVLGILAGREPASVESGLEAALAALENLSFSEVGGVPYLAHTVSSCGSFLSEQAGIAPGTSLAYLIAPPLESICGLDRALKAADVKLCKLYEPPSPTNFGGGLLSGSRSACMAACEAFAEGVREVAQTPR